MCSSDLREGEGGRDGEREGGREGEQGLSAANSTSIPESIHSASLTMEHLSLWSPHIIISPSACNASSVA